MAVPIFTHITTMSRARMRSANNRNKVENKSNSDVESYIETKFRMRKEKFEKISMAKNPNSSKETLIELSKSDDVDVILALINNPNLPLDLLYKLSENSNSYVRIKIAELEKCPLDLLIKLSSDKNIDVRKSALRNPNFPIDKLFEIAEMDFAINDVFFTIAKNTKKPSVLLRIIDYLDRNRNKIEYSYEIYEQVFKNRNCPIYVLNKALHDRYSVIREYAKKTLISRASSNLTTGEELRAISRIKDVNIQLLVANNPNCPLDTLLYLKDNTLLLFFSKNARKRIKEMQELTINSKFKTINTNRELEDTTDTIKEEYVEENNTELKL